jgi:transcriptional regulator with XRE-family HTH domain
VRHKDNPHPIGDRIRRARKKAAITQNNAAQSLGFQSQQWWAYEAGRIVPNGPRLVAIAKLLGVSVDWLATGKGRP